MRLLSAVPEAGDGCACVRASPSCRGVRSRRCEIFPVLDRTVKSPPMRFAGGIGTDLSRIHSAVRPRRGSSLGRNGPNCSAPWVGPPGVIDTAQAFFPLSLSAVRFDRSFASGARGTG